MDAAVEILLWDEKQNLFFLL